MIRPLVYEPEADFIMPILAVDDDMPLTRLDYEIDTEKPIAPYIPEVVKPQVNTDYRPQIAPIYEIVTPVLDDIIIPIKPVDEFNPVVVSNTGVNDTGRIILPKKPSVLDAIQNDTAVPGVATPEAQPAKSINPLYIVGGIVAAILVYKLIK